MVDQQRLEAQTKALVGPGATPLCTQQPDSGRCWPSWVGDRRWDVQFAKGGFIGSVKGFKTFLSLWTVLVTRLFIHSFID